MRLYDAHNHLHDGRFAGRQRELIETAINAGVARMVVNGSCEDDWPQVAALAREFPGVVIPSFGYHPWYVNERSPQWKEVLRRFLSETPGAVIGEIGLDRWKPHLSYAGQEEVFGAQLRLASDLNLPVSIHCLQAWGRLHELLRDGWVPERGFLLHSYGGSAEMVAPLAQLGARFSLPGFFAHERKSRQREAFQRVPPDRLLIETDAPDQLLPEERNAHPLREERTGKALNHPANLRQVYEFAAQMFGEPVDQLAARVERNFLDLFGGR
jgi:TatD DNase family protein